MVKQVGFLYLILTPLEKKNIVIDINFPIPFLYIASLINDFIYAYYYQLWDFFSFYFMVNIHLCKFDARTCVNFRQLMFKKEFDSSYVGFMRDGAKWLVENTDIKLVGKM